MSDAVIRLEELSKPTHAEWGQLGLEIDRSLIETLRSLADEEWNQPTECTPWSVKDVLAHTMGWTEATISPTELSRQTIAGVKTKSKHSGNWLDAANQFQVDTRSPSTPKELLARFEEMVPKYHRVRARYGLTTGFIPIKEPFSGTLVPLRFLFDTIFVRDHFMHHIDITHALGREMPIGDAERRVAHDAFREWAKKTKADVTLELSGPAGGRFAHGTGETVIAGDAIDLCRVLAGRRCDTWEITGDNAAAQKWLATLAAF